MLLKELYRKFVGCEPSAITLVTPAGSNRRYYRLYGPITVIGVEGVDRSENDAFIYLSRHFASLGLPVPEILGVSHDGMSYLECDLGDISLYNELHNTALLEKTMCLLARFHCIGTHGLDFSRCFPVEAFDFRSVMWDLNYFKYSFLNTSGVSYSELMLENDFNRIAKCVDSLTASCGCFMLRDFQSRNVMVKDDEIYFIDYQGGRRGPAAYDVASFLWQARAGFSPEIRHRLIGIYLDEACQYNLKLNRHEFGHQLQLMALIRTLQVLGAYGLRGNFERKQHFLSSIPYAIRNLRLLIDDGVCDEYAYLKEVLSKLVCVCEPDNSGCPDTSYDGLTVKVNSFSYKKGIPSDCSGNGGGFVFDCRAMDNPGRYDEYKQLTGLDKTVIDFLESRGEITRFLKQCYCLVDDAVGNYLSRGFTSLMVSFGCTGGRHRSVYSAEHLAEHIKSRFPQVRVELCHRERGLKRVL